MIPTAHPGISFYGRSGNNDHLYFRPHSDAIGVQKAYYDGTVHVQTALAGKFPWNTWNHVSVKLTGDSVQPALNGVSLGTFTTCQYDTAYDEIGLTAHTGGRNYYDWILIRKAVQNEPAHGSWGSGEVNPCSHTGIFLVSDEWTTNRCGGRKWPLLIFPSADPWNRVSHRWLDEAFPTNRGLHDDMGAWYHPADNCGIMPVMV